MKYRVGDNVKYHTTERTEKTCECCGNVDTEYKEITRTGIIEKASLEFVYTVANGFIHDNDEVRPGGSIVHFPSITPTDVLALLGKENV